MNLVDPRGTQEFSAVLPSIPSLPGFPSLLPAVAAAAAGVGVGLAAITACLVLTSSIPTDSPHPYRRPPVRCDLDPATTEFMNDNLCWYRCQDGNHTERDRKRDGSCDPIIWKY